MAKLVNSEWGRENHLGLDFNEEPMEGNDVNDQPTPIVKLPQVREDAPRMPNYQLVAHTKKMWVGYDTLFLTIYK